MIDMLNIKSTDHILEIGCGWGGFFSRAVKRTGCKVTAVMNSPSQAAYNRQMIETKGMKQYIDLQEIDCCDIKGKYDKIVSIEMIEAVGEQYWNNYFQKISASIKGKGQAIIQGITIHDDYFYSYRQKTDFIQNYIFPGGMLLANSIFNRKSKENGMQLSDQFEFGISYADTLKLWRERFHEAKNKEESYHFSDDKFDRVMSIEMMEHLRNYEKFFSLLEQSMKPDAKFFVHVFTHKNTPYFFETEGEDNWMGKYFFSGGQMPARDLFDQFNSHLKVENKWDWNGTHYQKTLEAWLVKMDQNEEKVRKLFAQAYGEQNVETWINRWRVFYMACAELFGFNKGSEWAVTHYLLSPNG